MKHRWLILFIKADQTPGWCIVEADNEIEMQRLVLRQADSESWRTWEEREINREFSIVRQYVKVLTK